MSSRLRATVLLLAAFAVAAGVWAGDWLWAAAS